MKLVLIALALGTLYTAGSSSGSMRREHAARSEPQAIAQVPPAAWADADPADSLYRAARQALTRKDYEAAARIYLEIAAKYPRSEYTPDAYYWRGFSLYRGGHLDQAQDALEMQARKYPSASTTADAATLLIMVKGEQAKRGDASAQRDVSTAASASAQGKGCGDMETQTAALDALQQMDAERVTPLLKKVLARRDACSTPLRKSALFILAQKSGDDREKILLDVARNDPSPEVRQDAVFHLQQATSPAAVDALEDLLLHGTDAGVRKNALFALSQNRSDRSRKILRTFALTDDAPMALRTDAVFQIAAGGDAGDLAWLQDAYHRISDQKLRSDVMFHISSRQAPEVSKFLVSVIVDNKENFDQRKNALFLLSSRSTTTGEDMAGVYDRVPQALRKEVMFHLGTRKDGASLDKLISIAKTDTSPQMRKDAMFHIGQSKDPKALKALEEIVAP